MGDGRLVACCIIKIQNKLKYNFPGRVSLLQVATVLESALQIGLKGSSYGGLFFRDFIPRESRIGLSLREFRIIEGSRNRG